MVVTFLLCESGHGLLADWDLWWSEIAERRIGIDFFEGLAVAAADCRDFLDAFGILSVEAAVVGEEKLERAGRVVADGLGAAHGDLAHLGDRGGRGAGAGRGR